MMTAINSESLITTVEKHPAVWDTACTDYKDRQKKVNAVFYTTNIKGGLFFLYSGQPFVHLFLHTLVSCDHSRNTAMQ